MENWGKCIRGTRAEFVACQERILSARCRNASLYTPHDRRRTLAPDMNSNGVHEQSRTVYQCISYPTTQSHFLVFVYTLILSVLALWRLFSCAPASCVCKSRIPSRYTRRYSPRHGEVMHPSSQLVRDPATCHSVVHVLDVHRSCRWWTERRWQCLLVWLGLF